MVKFTLTICLSTLFSTFLFAQSGCPGCSVNLPANLPSDTVYLPTLPDGISGIYYETDISFRLPRTTTPVHAIDSTTPSGLTISKFEIVSIEGLPPGMFWQPNQFNFDMPSETDGCLKICGTPHEADSFKLIVTLRATVLFVAQEATFPMSLYIAPKVSNTNGFSMTNPEGCGSTTVTFTNNVPSNGVPGFSYSWNFGDGSPLFTGENPAAHSYQQPGTYLISYHASVDTAGYFLESVRVLDVDCVDELGLGTPDLYMEIYEPVSGNKVFDSSPYVNNTPLPYLFPVGIKLGPGNYLIQVKDEDSGLKGSDDDCGMATFNYLSNGTLIAGGLEVEMNIIHPVEEVNAVDTVTVFPIPTLPVLAAPNGLSACDNGGGILLNSSYSSGNQWLLNGSNIPGATDSIYAALETGYYQVQIISQDGCVGNSDSALVELYALPVQPIWFNLNNSLRLFDTTGLPLQYSLQWFSGSNPIPGENGFRYCATSSGSYGLVITDLATGCTSSYFNQVIYNPDFDCTVALRELATHTLKIMPNPSSQWINVALSPSTEAGSYRLLEVTGRQLMQGQFAAGETLLAIDVSKLPYGVYGLEIRQAGAVGVGKVVKN